MCRAGFGPADIAKETTEAHVGPGGPAPSPQKGRPEAPAELCHIPETATQVEPTDPPTSGELAELLLSAPPMTGAEYLTAEVLTETWCAIDEWVDIGRTDGLLVGPPIRFQPPSPHGSPGRGALPIANPSGAATPGAGSTPPSTPSPSGSGPGTICSRSAACGAKTHCHLRRGGRALPLGNLGDGRGGVRGNQESCHGGPLQWCGLPLANKLARSPPSRTFTAVPHCAATGTSYCG